MFSSSSHGSSNQPAEVFRKDLISAMKLPDSYQLLQDEYMIMTDNWKPEWEKGVQVPVNPHSIPHAWIDEVRKPEDVGFKLPKKMIKGYDPEEEKEDSPDGPAKKDATCQYDLDEVDVHWLELTNETRREMGDEAIDELTMERIIEECELQCNNNMEHAMQTEEGLGIEYDEDVICDVCRAPDSEEGNEMVFCDKCDICVHQACYGIMKVPEGSWMCRTCALSIQPVCILCGIKGGAMKSTRSGTKWSHVSCALWVPEVSIGCVERMEPITKISQIPASRWALICVICRERTGACIQCSVKTCKTAYHVTCGFEEKLEMKTFLDDEADVRFRSYCMKHTKMRREMDGLDPKLQTPEKIRTDKPHSEKLHIKPHSEKTHGTPKKEMTQEERANERAIRIQLITEEFYRFTKMKEIASALNMKDDPDTVDMVYEYWKLKRKSGHNKPLVTPTKDVGSLGSNEEYNLTARMKMFVHLRQDLERVRNLCYMVQRREKLSRQFSVMNQSIFRKQCEMYAAGKEFSEKDLLWALEIGKLAVSLPASIQEAKDGNSVKKEEEKSDEIKSKESESKESESKESTSDESKNEESRSEESSSEAPERTPKSQCDDTSEVSDSQGDHKEVKKEEEEEEDCDEKQSKEESEAEDGEKENPDCGDEKQIKEEMEDLDDEKNESNESKVILLSEEEEEEEEAAAEECKVEDMEEESKIEDDMEEESKVGDDTEEESKIEEDTEEESKIEEDTEVEERKVEGDMDEERKVDEFLEKESKVDEFLEEESKVDDFLEEERKVVEEESKADEDMEEEECKLDEYAEEKDETQKSVEEIIERLAEESEEEKENAFVIRRSDRVMLLDGKQTQMNLKREDSEISQVSPPRSRESSVSHNRCGSPLSVDADVSDAADDSDREHFVNAKSSVSPHAKVEEEEDEEFEEEEVIIRRADISRLSPSSNASKYSAHSDLETNGETTYEVASRTRKVTSAFSAAAAHKLAPTASPAGASSGVSVSVSDDSKHKSSEDSERPPDRPPLKRKISLKAIREAEMQKNGLSRKRRRDSHHRKSKHRSRSESDEDSDKPMYSIVRTPTRDSPSKISIKIHSPTKISPKKLQLEEEAKKIRERVLSISPSPRSSLKGYRIPKKKTITPKPIMNGPPKKEPPEYDPFEFVDESEEPVHKPETRSRRKLIDDELDSESSCSDRQFESIDKEVSMCLPGRESPFAVGGEENRTPESLRAKASKDREERLKRRNLGSRIRDAAVRFLNSTMNNF